VTEYVSQIASHLQIPRRLLVERYSHNTGDHHHTQIICIFTGVAAKYRGCVHDPVASQTGCVVFGLAPKHKMHAARKQDVRLKIDITVDHDEVSRDAQF
jgi:hypothetical protein